MFVLVVCVCLLSVPLGDSINNVVRFICKGCMPESTECCVGTILSSNYIVTSNYCAEMCKLVEVDKKIHHIIKYHIFPYAKTFAMGFNIIGSNTIGLVEIDLKLKNNTSFINLIPLDINLVIGAEAIILDAKTHRVAKIKHCKEDLSHLLEYYVCAGEKYFEDCYIRQGTPLILNNVLLGIMGVQDSNNCEYSQRSFIAIKPMIYWIKYTVDSQSYNQKKQLLFNLNYRRDKMMTSLKTASTNFNIVKDKIHSKNNTISSKTLNQPKNKVTYSTHTKKKQRKSTKKYIAQTSYTKSILKKNMKQDKKYKSTKKNTKKYKITSKKIILKRKINTPKHKAKASWKGIIIRRIKVKPPKHIRKQKDCSRIMSEIPVIVTTTKKLSTKPIKTKLFSLQTKSITYKPKKKVSPKTKNDIKHNIKRSKTNSKKIYFKAKPTSSTSKKKNPEKTIVKQSYKTTKFLTTTIKNNGSSLPFFNLTTKSLNLNEISSTLTEDDNITTVKTNEIIIPTNALDWFRSAFKNISNDSKPILVLDVPTVKTEFIDLT